MKTKTLLDPCQGLKCRSLPSGAHPTALSEHGWLGQDDRKLTTAELAGALSMREQSIRKRLSQTGSFFGFRPFKLPNGRLRWPRDLVEHLMSGNSVTSTSEEDTQ